MITTHQRAYREALVAGDKPGQDRLDRDRDHLAKGIFVLLFAEFEVAMNGSFDRARALRQSNADWTVRRSWDTPDCDERPSFETRLATMLDRNSSEYGEAIAAYGIRNACGHGRTTTAVGSIDRLVDALYRWRSAL